MKMNKIVFVAVVVMVAALISCGGEAGAPGLPDDVTATGTLGSTLVKNESEAYSLLNYAFYNSDFLNYLSAVDGKVTQEAFAKAYSIPYTDDDGIKFDDLKKFIKDYETKTDADFSIEFDKAATIGKDNDTLTATVKGSVESSSSSNREFGIIYELNAYNNDNWDPLKDGYMANRKEGDETEGSSSYEKTFTITGSKLGSEKQVITGVIEVKGSNSSSSKLIKKAGDGPDGDWEKDEADKYEEDSSEDWTVAVDLYVDDGTKAARFKFTYAMKGNWSVRAAEWYGGNSRSDVQVLNASGGTLFTLQTAAESYATTISRYLRGSYSPF